MSELQKVMAQFALLFVVVWVVASALGKGSQVTLGAPAPRNQKGGCNPYRGQFSKYGARRYYESRVAVAADASNLPAGTYIL